MSTPPSAAAARSSLAVLCALLLFAAASAMLVFGAAGGRVLARSSTTNETTPRPKKRTRAQEIHDLNVLYLAHMKRYRADLASSQEYARRGDKVQASAMRMNAEDSRKKAAGFKRRSDALQKGGRSARGR